MTRKKKFIVLPRQGGAVLDGIQTSRGHRHFNGKTYLHVSDPSEAAEIEQRYGRKGTQAVYVAEDEQYARALNGERWEVKSSLQGDNVKLLHNYTFGPMSSPAAEKFWKRYQRKKRGKNGKGKGKNRYAESQRQKTD